MGDVSTGTSISLLTGSKLTNIFAEEKPEPTNLAPPGSICDVHNLYQSKPDGKGRTSWTDKYPDDLENPAENSKSGQYALIVRNSKCYDGRKSLEIHSIVIQSQRLKTFLGGVMEEYPGLTMNLDRVEFKRPFKPFVHRWEQFREARDGEQDPETKAHVDLLYKILEKELRDTISSRENHIANGVITHALLWTIFEPDGIVYSVVDGRQRAFEFESGSTDCRTGAFEISARYCDYDGRTFGPTSHLMLVPFYEGTSPITSLPVFPLEYHGEKDKIRKDLIVRGKLWEDHQGYHYKQYEDIAKAKFCGRQIKFNVNSRIVIDADAFNTFSPNSSISLDDEFKEKLTDDQRLIATPTVRGYSLKDKRWLEFFIDGVKDITWNSQAFDSLVLPHAQQDLKQLILAFAEAQSQNVDTFDDIIQGKGRGVIMLLSGPPGVGKTLTAESVAEVMKVPLYVLSAGDLGTSASDVEDTLKDILRIVPRWGAVLLLDEADVFMEARNTTDLERNELVSIFLRMLEYYEVSRSKTPGTSLTIESLGIPIPHQQPRGEYRSCVRISHPRVSALPRAQHGVQTADLVAVPW